MTLKFAASRSPTTGRPLAACSSLPTANPYSHPNQPIVVTDPTAPPDEGERARPLILKVESAPELGTAFALLVSTHELVPVAAALLLLGAGTVWISYSRGWRGIWWLPLTLNLATPCMLQNSLIHLSVS